MTDPAKPPDDTKDANSIFSGMSGTLKQVVAAGIFACLAVYVFWFVPAERKEARDHGEKMMKEAWEMHKADRTGIEQELKDVFKRLLDVQRHDKEPKPKPTTK